MSQVMSQTSFIASNPHIDYVARGTRAGPYPFFYLDCLLNKQSKNQLNLCRNVLRETILRTLKTQKKGSLRGGVSGDISTVLWFRRTEMKHTG